MISKLQYITQDIPDRTHAELAGEACLHGISWVQFRSKLLKGDDLIKSALDVKNICTYYKSIFIINDYVRLAKEIKADGVHLGKSDITPIEARKILGSGFLIGGTANTFEDILSLHEQGVDYIGLGPFRFTETKKNLSPILGIDGYKEIVSKCREHEIDIPIIAIGGIIESDVEEIMQTGVYGIAVSSVITNSSNKKKTVASLHATMNTMNTLLRNIKF